MFLTKSDVMKCLASGDMFINGLFLIISGSVIASTFHGIGVCVAIVGVLIFDTAIALMSSIFMDAVHKQKKRRHVTMN